MLIEFRTTCKICSFLLLLSLLSAEIPEIKGYVNRKNMSEFLSSGKIGRSNSSNNKDGELIVEIWTIRLQDYLD